MRRADFVYRWRRKAHESGDPFDTFFSAWVALVIAARGRLEENQLAQPDTDRVAVIQFFESQAHTIVALLKNLSDSTAWLAERKGTATGRAILDVHHYSPQHLRQVFDDLAEVWSGRTDRKPRWIACATAEMINHIRNNMFHGVKAPEDAGDVALLEHANPILIGILDAL
jgi:hypothetical protein